MADRLIELIKSAIEGITPAVKKGATAIADEAVEGGSFGIYKSADDLATKIATDIYGDPDIPLDSPGDPVPIAPETFASIASGEATGIGNEPSLSADDQSAAGSVEKSTPDTFASQATSNLNDDPRTTALLDVFTNKEGNPYTSEELKSFTPVELGNMYEQVTGKKLTGPANENYYMALDLLRETEKLFKAKK